MSFELGSSFAEIPLSSDVGEVRAESVFLGNLAGDGLVIWRSSVLSVLGDEEKVSEKGESLPRRQACIPLSLPSHRNICQGRVH